LARKCAAAALPPADSFAAAAAAVLLLPVLLVGLLDSVAAEAADAGRGLSSRFCWVLTPLGDELKLMWLCCDDAARKEHMAGYVRLATP
jgi:hypothetical protein